MWSRRVVRAWQLFMRTRLSRNHRTRLTVTGDYGAVRILFVDLWRAAAHNLYTGFVLMAYALALETYKPASQYPLRGPEVKG